MTDFDTVRLPILGFGLKGAIPMTEQEFKQKTKRLALQTIALVEGLSHGMTS